MAGRTFSRFSARAIMSGGSIPIGRLFGIPLRLHYTWFIIFALVTVSLSWQVFPEFYPRWPESQYWIVGIATSLLFFASVLAHELSHSIVSAFNGVPVKSITLFIFGGVAQISREASRPMAELVMAAAGPLSSLLIAAIFGGVWLATRSVNQQVAALGEWLAVINAQLAVFNMIPGFPLDGGRVFRSIFWRITGNYKKSTHIATTVGKGIAFVFIFIGIVMMFFDTPFFPHSWFSGLWLAFIGWFLHNAASASYRQVIMRESFHGYTARDVMTTDFPYVPRSLSLGELARNHILPTGHRSFLVLDSEQHLEGIITLSNLKTVPNTSWDLTLVQQVMTPREQVKAASLEDAALDLLEAMDEEDVNQMPLVQDGRVIGVVMRDNILRFIQTRSELAR